MDEIELHESAVMILEKLIDSSIAYQLMTEYVDVSDEEAIVALYNEMNRIVEV